MLPRDLELVIAGIKLATPRAMLVLCVESANSAAKTIAMLGRTTVVEIPSMASRRQQLDRLLLEFASDAAATLGVATTGSASTSSSG